MNPFSLQEGHILVTGASSGIGRSIAIEVANAGAAVTLIGRNEQRLTETMDSMPGQGHQCVPLDVCDEEATLQAVVDLPKFTGVVHAAGVYQPTPAKFFSRGDFNNIIGTNLYGAMQLTRSLLLKKKIMKAASLVLISSLLGTELSETGSAVYSSSKAGLLAYSKVLATELAVRQIRVNTISPGMIDTPMVSSFAFSNEERQVDEQRYPLGYGRPEDVAYAAVYLLSPAARWITGTNLILDGGRTLR